MAVEMTFTTGKFFPRLCDCIFLQTLLHLSNVEGGKSKRTWKTTCTNNEIMNEIYKTNP